MYVFTQDQENQYEELSMWTRSLAHHQQSVS
jgi:hypothetical protein